MTLHSMGFTLLFIRGIKLNSPLTRHISRQVPIHYIKTAKMQSQNGTEQEIVYKKCPISAVTNSFDRKTDLAYGNLKNDSSKRVMKG